MNNMVPVVCYEVSIKDYLLFFNALYLLQMKVEIFGRISRILNQMMYFCKRLFTICF